MVHGTIESQSNQRLITVCHQLQCHFLVSFISHVVLELQIVGAEDCGPTAAFPIPISLRLLTSFPAGLAPGYFCLLFHSFSFLFFLLCSLCSLWCLFLSLCLLLCLFFWGFHSAVSTFISQLLSLPWPDSDSPELQRSLLSARIQYHLMKNYLLNQAWQMTIWTTYIWLNNSQLTTYKYELTEFIFFRSCLVPDVNFNLLLSGATVL